LIKLPVLAKAGPAGMAGVFGAQGFGGTRRDIAELRNQGEQIGTGKELATAAGVGTTQAVASLLLGKIWQGLSPDAVNAAKTAGEPAVKSLVQRLLSEASSTAGTMFKAGTDMAVTQYVTNKIMQGVDPHRAASDGVAEAFANGAILAPVGARFSGHGTATRPEEQTAAPVPSAAPEAAPTPEPVKPAVPAPDAATLATLTTQPKAEAIPAPVLDSARTKYRVQNGAESRAIDLTFENPTDKALYVASQPRKGKLQAEARKFLTAQGYNEDSIAAYADELRGRVDQLAAGHRGDSLAVPAEQRAINTKEGGSANQPANGLPGGNVVPAPVAEPVPETPAAEPQRIAGPPQPEAAAAPANAGPALKAGEQQGTLFNPARFKDQAPTGETPLGRRTRIARMVEEAGGTYGEAAPANKTQAEYTRQVQKHTGLKVVWGDGNGWGGFIDPQDKSTLHLNRRLSSDRLASTAIHELWHHVQDLMPGLAKSAERAIGDKNLARVLDSYAKRRENSGLGSSFNQAEEAGATAIEMLAKHPGVAGKLSIDTRTWLQRMADGFKEFFGFKQDRPLSKLESHIAGVLDRAYDALREGNAPAQRPAVDSTPAVSEVRGMAAAPATASAPEPSPALRGMAKEYTAKYGVPYNPTESYATVNEPRAREIAAWYEQAKHEPNSPEVKASYDAMKKETLDQYNYLKDKGYTLEPWKGEGQPYKNSGEVIADVRNNKHLFFFTGGEMPADHPLAAPAPGTDLTYNDVFRAVHDFFGHAKEGVGFGPRGEENAWRSHSQMYSDLARRAMTVRDPRAKLVGELRAARGAQPGQPGGDEVRGAEGDRHPRQVPPRGAGGRHAVLAAEGRRGVQAPRPEAGEVLQGDQEVPHPRGTVHRGQEDGEGSRGDPREAPAEAGVHGCRRHGQGPAWLVREGRRVARLAVRGRHAPVRQAAGRHQPATAGEAQPD
jgi:hypothetical protein